MAQERMPQIPADKLTEAQKKASAEFAEGRFAAYMHVQLVNDGPVTLLLDSRRAF